MKTLAGWWMCVLVLALVSAAVPKQHVVAFGKWTSVKLLAGDDESTPVDVTVRALFVDGRTKEFTTGAGLGIWHLALGI